MAVRILDLQLIYGVAGAREHFERLCTQLIRSKFPDGKGVQVHQGDGGVDTSVGEWADSGGIHVFQVKFFPTGLGDDQKKQIRGSFKTCLANPRFTTTKWTLCLPVDLSQIEIPWFNNWKEDNATDTLTSDNIDYWGATELEELLFKPENKGILDAFFQQEHLTQIREIHGMLTKLIDDISLRLGVPTKETLISPLVNYFQHNLKIAQRMLAVLEKQQLPNIRFDTSSWAVFMPFALSSFPTSFNTMAETVRLLEQGNNLAVAIWDRYKSNKYPPGSGINLDAPSPYVIDAIKRLDVHIRSNILPSLVSVLTAFITS